MKKVFSIVFVAASLALASCGSSTGGDVVDSAAIKAKADSVANAEAAKAKATADSLAKATADKAKADSTMKADSIAKATKKK